MKKTTVIIFISVITVLNLHAQYKTSKSIWIDSTLGKMTIEEKIGQLFMIRAFSKEDNEHIKSVRDQISKYKVGGVCFFQGDPLKQTYLAEDYQSRANIPLLIAIDGEWGLGMRFPDKAISFPRQITIGAINDNQLIYRMGYEIGRQCRLTGLNVNFAPDVDVNNNSANPVINMRSFGEDPFNVATKAYAYMKGLADAGVMSCAKHFPGHGDTDVDSHKDLPVIAHDRRRLDSIELYPFKMLIQHKVPSIMIAHLMVPALDDSPDVPTSLSQPVVTGLLREEYGYDGLIYTDAMEMQAVTKHYGPGEADLQVFLAGNDIVLLPSDISAGYNSIMNAYKSGRISDDRLNKSLVRILGAKYDLGLYKQSNLAHTDNIYQELNSDEAINIKTEIYEKALTLVSNQDQLLPLRSLSGINFASISLGAKRMTGFQERILSYVDSDNYWLSKEATPAEYSQKLELLSKKDIVIVGLHDMSWYVKNAYGINNAQIDFIHDLAKKTKVILTIFGTPYALASFENIKTTLVAYEDNDISQDVAAQALFGVTDITGKLPVSASAKYFQGVGLIIPGIKRIGYSRPERVGIESDSLERIAGIIEKMIEEKAAPGCQIVIAKDNRIVYEKAFGYHLYDGKQAAANTDIYDLASVTKIMATTISLMQLDDKGLFELDDTVGQYIPEADTTNKSGLVYADMLAHVAGLAGWIPFYRHTLTEDRRPVPSPQYYKSTSSDSFPIKVTDKLYLRFDYPDTIWRDIFASDLRDSRDYRYSDLAFYIANRTIKNITGTQVDVYADEFFYKPLGLRTTGFNPLRRFDKKRIPPTEKDDYFRMTTIQGTVHDMGAAMLSGVSGHAGLFSNAHDVAVLMQMLINKGYYGGYQYIKPATVERYTHRHWASSRRGLGFDMKELNPDKSLNMSEKASRNTFGHLGFTGTCVFGDPDHNIVFVMLANRTYPTMENNKFGKNDYRPRVQEVIYNALIPESNRQIDLTY